MNVNNNIRNKEIKHRSTFAILFYINRTKVRKDGTCQLLCKVSVDAKWEQIGIKVAVNPALWNPETGRADGRSENALTVNRAINDLDKQIRGHYKRIKNSLGFVTAELIKNAMLGIGEKKLTLLVLFTEHNEEFKKRIGVDREKGSYESYTRSYRHLHEFIRDKKKTEDVTLKSLDQDFYDDFELYLRSDCGMQQKTVHEHLYRLKKMTKRALSQGTLRRDPYDELHPALPKRKSRHLKYEDLTKLMATQLDKPNLQRVRDWFIFSSFTGLAYVDIMLLHPHHIGTNADGRRYIRINRKKTKIEAFIPLHPIAERILSLYNTTDDEHPVFPLPNRDALWFEIHELGVIIGKEDNLSYHQSRHSFGTFLISSDIPIESIAKMMGHSNIRTTQGYARITDDKISKDMDKLMERRKIQSIGEKTDNNK